MQTDSEEKAVFIVKRAQISSTDTEVLLDFDQAVSMCPPQLSDLHFEFCGFSGDGVSGWGRQG